MTACARFAPMIGARPGELPEEEVRAFAEHLASCDACQARAADDEALSGMLPEALLAEASRRDFSAFSDEVLARIPAYRDEAPGRGSLRAPAPEREGGWLAPVRAWVRRHRVAAASSALAPALAALVAILYLGREPEPEPSVEVSAEGGGAMVLETSDGPMVLFGDADRGG